MGDLERRLRDLESRTPPTPRGRLGSVTGAEIRALEKHIKRLESGEVGAAPSPEVDVARSVEPDEETAAVVRKIAWLEELERASEGRTRWT
jgi:hypothetical protein